MKYQHVCVESLGYTLPDEIVTTAEIERRLAPLYERLRLPEGRLELMTGIRERRFWAPGTMPSDISVITGNALLESAGIDRGKVGALLHGSVCRDFIEPATACSVHHRLGLPEECVIYDVSNACLGLLNGMLQIADRIELGQIQAGIVVGTESGRNLVERTIDTLNNDLTLTRDQMKLAIASLTIGSASAAILLTHRSISRTGNRLIGAAVRAHTQHSGLCHGNHDGQAGGGAGMLMQTDSERLMAEGIAVGLATFNDFLTATGWSRSAVDKTFCHQIGTTHRRLMLGALDLDLALDYPTVETLGNTGAVALPVTMALGIEQGHLQRGDHVALLGIGSGINSIMIGVDWQTTPTPAHQSTIPAPHVRTSSAKA